MRRGAETEPRRRVAKRKIRPIILPAITLSAVAGLIGCSDGGEYPTLRYPGETFDFSLQQRGPDKITIVGHDQDGLDGLELVTAGGTLGKLGCEIDTTRATDDVEFDGRKYPAKITVFTFNKDCVGKAVDLQTTPTPG